MRDVWLAVDIGGTKIAAAIYESDALRCKHTIPTLATSGEEKVLERLCRLLKLIREESSLERVRGIGVACPGPLSARRGVVLKAPTLGWENVPLAAMLQERFDCPVLLENDANAAALGEYRFGAGQGASSMAYITVSTGVGCGIVLDGKLVRGFHEGAGELGHLVVRHGGRPCACGRLGCLECYASGTAIGRDASRVLRRRGEAREISAREAAELAYKGDAELRHVFADASFSLGLGIAALLQILDLERVVIGGSVAQSMDLIVDSILEGVRSECYWPLDENSLRKAQLSGNAGLLGAALLIQNA